MTTATAATTAILDGARLLGRHGGLVEVRIPKVARKGTISGYFTTAEALARAVQPWDGRAPIYVTANPVRPALLARAANRLKEFATTTTGDAEIDRRVWFLVDLDPKRPAGISSTDDEEATALARRNDVVAFLYELGWSTPVLARSGNGGHALYPVDLPNTDEMTALFSGALKALASRFSDDAVTLDEAVFNAARIWKLYGTIAAKGDSIPDRPHRRAALESVPDIFDDVSVEMLRELAAMAPPPPRTVSTPGAPGRHLEPLDLVGAFTSRGLYKRALGTEKHAVTCPWSTEHSGDSGTTETCLFPPREPGTPWGFKCMHAHCTNRRIKDVLATLGLNGYGHHHPGATSASSTPPPSGRSAVILSATDITPEAMRWHWPGRLAVGALTNAVGLPDVGKTLVYIDVTARITIGAPMPPAPSKRGEGEPGRVLILTLEDSLSTTIVPRLIKAGAELALVDFVQMVRDAQGNTSLVTLAEDLDVLSAALEAKDYTLMVIDGITGYLGAATKSHNDADVRRILAPFAAMLDRTRVAGLSVMHPPKQVTNLAYYAGGSTAFTSVPRVSLGIAKDPNDDSPNPRRFVGKIKGNLYGPVPTLAYHIKADGPADIPWIEWEPEPVDVNLADILDPVKETPEQRGARQQCIEWLRSHLADGPKRSEDVEAAAKANGFSPATLRRARETVCDSVKRGGPKSGKQEWLWSLRTPKDGAVR